jgi:aminoglycoside phosphotransferase (APT) family kinase protein
MKITFTPLAESHFPLLLKWLEMSHVKKMVGSGYQMDPSIDDIKYPVVGMDEFKSHPVTVMEVEFMNNKSIMPTLDLARKLIAEQFPEYAGLPITDVEKQGHDNRTYRLGSDMLIRMPTAADYALKVPKEQELLPQLAKRLSINIPAPIKMGNPSSDYPYPFSIYKWLPGKSINLLTLTDQDKEQLAFDLSKFLKELQAISDVKGPEPGQHNWWRGDHVSVYDKGAREQIAKLADFIDVTRALALWDRASATKWNKTPVWIHGILLLVIY